MKKNVKILTCTALSMMLANSTLAVFAKDEDETTKDETVYAMLNSDGTVDEEIVSSWLHNDHGIKNIKEKLNIDDVKNVKSDEKPAISGDMYTWNSESNDIYYEGTTKKALPIDINVTYLLDGKEIKGEDLVGKSGKLEIHIKMKSTKTKNVNINGKSTRIHPLYVGAGILDLSTDHFKNVTINSGKIISEGNNQIAGFVSIPGLEDTLTSSGIDADKLNFSDEYVISCDTTDFEMGPIMIAFTPEVPLDKLKDINSLDDLTNGLDQLTDVSQRLLDGTSQLADGTNTFSNKMAELVDGAPALTNGVDTLKNGTAQLVNGSQSLSSHLEVLNNGLVQAKNGSQILADRTAKGSELANGAAAIDQGVGQMQTLLNTKQQELSNLLEGEAYQTLMESLSSIQTLSEGVNTLNDGAANLNGAINGENVQKAAEDVQANAARTIGQCKNGEITDNQQCALAQEQLLVAGTLMGTSEGAETLSHGMQQLKNEIDKMTSLNDAAKQLNESISSFQQEFAAANQQVAQLKAGTSQLVSGISTLNQGITTLDGSMDTIANGASQLYDGSKTLKDGILSADQGVSQLKNGTAVIQNGASQLYDASNLLADKTKELNQGMGTFKQDGIDKMKSEVSLTMDDVNQLLAIKDEIVKEAEQEHSFTGAPEDSESSVKFIYKTDDLEKEKNAETDDKATKNEEKSQDDGWMSKIQSFLGDLF